MSAGLYIYFAQSTLSLSLFSFWDNLESLIRLYYDDFARITTNNNFIDVGLLLTSDCVLWIYKSRLESCQFNLGAITWHQSIKTSKFIHYFSIICFEIHPMSYIYVFISIRKNKNSFSRTSTVKESPTLFCGLIRKCHHTLINIFIYRNYDRCEYHKN